LLTGSLGTLGVISQVTLRLKPLPEQSALVACCVGDEQTAEKLLPALVSSLTTPVAIELLACPAWDDHPALKTLDNASGRSASQRLYLVAGLEGTAPEVEFMIRQLSAEWRQQGVAQSLVVGESSEFWQRLTEFPAEGDSPLVLKASMVPSGVTPLVAAARKLDPHCSIQAHAGNGTVLIRLSRFPEGGLSRALVGILQPVASAYHGHLVVLSNPGGSEMTHQSVWGGIDAPFDLMTEIKRRFDPKDILNRGRFVYL
jgi:glycolate oxidase FAD binding subunit